MKTLSIVIPTYNAEKFLERCLRSILQKEILEDIEVIIVNDGSKDNSLLLAKQYYEKYPQTVILIDKENGGHGSTINAGLEIATGKYFRVVDSDDWVNVDEFSAYVKRLEELDVDLVITNYTRELVYSGENFLFKYNSKLEYDKIYEFEQYNFQDLGLDYFFMATSTYKTQLLKKVKLKLDEKTFYVDMEYNIFPIAEIKNFIYCNFDIYRYFIGRAEQSINTASLIRNRKHHEKVLKRLINFYTTTVMSEKRKKYIQNILEQMLHTHYIIYCLSGTDKQLKKEIQEFDKFLSENCRELYELSNNRAYIRWNRRTNFNFSATKRHLFTRIVDAYEAKVAYRRRKK